MGLALFQNAVMTNQGSSVDPFQISSSPDARRTVSRVQAASFKSEPNSVSGLSFPDSLATEHVHRILIATPNGPTVEGRCACGYVQTYSSSGDDMGVWSASMQQKRMRAGAAMKRAKGGARSVAQFSHFYKELGE